MTFSCRGGKLLPRPSQGPGWVGKLNCNKEQRKSTTFYPVLTRTEPAQVNRGPGRGATQAARASCAKTGRIGEARTGQGGRADRAGAGDSARVSVPGAQPQAPSPWWRNACRPRVPGAPARGHYSLFLGGWGGSNFPLLPLKLLPLDRAARPGPVWG